MAIFQEPLRLQPMRRGFHLITHQIEKLIQHNQIETGICHIFIQHTSASLTINENADPTVRADFETHFNRMVPEGNQHYLHNYEGSDDMPAHLKSSILGSSVSVPLTNYRLNLGTWQGIYLCEHRDYGSARDLIVTIYG